MTNPPIVFIDCETTGLHADRRPWEIAMVRRDEYGEREITIQVEDVDLTTAELIGLKVGRFHERHVRYTDGHDPKASVMPERDAARAVETWTRGAHIIGACPNFDTETLAAMFRRHGLCPAWHYHLLDIEVMAMGWLAAQGTSVELPCKSDDLSRLCGIEPPSTDERHTAMGDTKWVLRWWDRITGGAE